MSRRSKDTEDPTAMDEDQNDDQEDNMDEGNNDQENEESEESEEEEPQVEYLVPKRERRANAGNKMAALLESAIHDDDFYSSAYGGFKEDDQDTAYVSPGHSDVDEVDSDFDQPEVEEEPASDQEEDPDKPRRSKRKGTYKEPSRGSLIEKNRKWVVARMGGAVVAPNACDPKTQAERLKEAEMTEKENTESLKKYEEYELEKKKRREKQVDRRVPPPFIKERSSIKGDLIVVPDVKRFHAVHKPSAFVCAVTGRKAKYRDPLTGLPYSSQFAFKVIRDKYTKYLKTKKGNPEVDAYLAQFY